MLQVDIKVFNYGTTQILRDIQFFLEAGKHLSILGESGCGKSTLLKLIYGTLQLHNGALSWNKEPILGPDFNLVPGESFIKMISQDFDLMPYTSVVENIGKFVSRLDMGLRQERIDELLEVVELTDVKDRKVKTLSGGQQQRVAIARALANEPELLLLDEPFSHIDNFRKNKLRRRLYKYLKSQNITCITATHDSEEALSFADELMVMQGGYFVAQGTPEDLYKSPNTAYVASFFEDVFCYKNELYYPHNISVAEKGDIKVEVIHSYFKGSFWLIEASFQKKIFYFKHYKKLENRQIVCLELKKD